MPLLIRLLTTTCICIFGIIASLPTTSSSSVPAPKKQNINTLNYSTFPRRLNSEAAVIEWGHSAIINAVDAVAASFGTRPDQGAFFEVEASPVLASPLDGSEELENCDDVGGNIVLMTTSEGMT
eukprot:CAMPEP_0182480950 /NCGR_PEP_ID=MMETSP1319-20130603/36581_1 /TAXON_ID=172717 /ORGANISM="Bolidomonas pacifica, Strain RCC208" /LENGTH=123 /DNA_ID=CAMNT_0024682513 /DNA_START=191 /DNA_END=558 /DNA_ORIENTATION=+